MSTGYRDEINIVGKINQLALKKVELAYIVETVVSNLDILACSGLTDIEELTERHLLLARKKLWFNQPVFRRIGKMEIGP